MSQKNSQSYERYLTGVEMQKEGATGEEIAKALGLKNAQAWYATRAYHGGKKLADRALDLKEDQPEKAAILADIDCERRTPREALPRVRRTAAPGLFADRQEGGQMMTGGEEVRYQPKEAAPKAPRLDIKRAFTAQGEKLRYRVEGDVVRIGAAGGKRSPLNLSPAECRVMLRELEELLSQIGEK